MFGQQDENYRQFEAARSIKRRHFVYPMFIFSISFDSNRFEKIWKTFLPHFDSQSGVNTKVCAIFLRILNCQFVIAFFMKVGFFCKSYTGIFNLSWFLSNYSWQYKIKSNLKNVWLPFYFRKAAYSFQLQKARMLFVLEHNGRNSQILFKNSDFFFAF